MTTTAVPTSEPRQGLRQGPADQAFRVFAAAVAVGLLHALDDAVLNRQPGVPADQHLAALAFVTVAGVLATVAFRRLGTGLRALISLVIGSVTLTNGAMHLVHVVRNDVSGSDVTGVLAALAGAALVLMAAALPFLHRGERNLPPVPRWAIRGLAALSVPVLMFGVIMPIGVGLGQTHLFRDPIGAPPDGRYTAVVFESTDGLRLSGWYAPSRNGAAVVLVNSSGGDRLGSVRHAGLLAKHGYGVLLYDARGTGDSEGSPNGYGWNWDRDVDGAIEFLQRQPGVDPGRIGGLGLSTGADVLIEVAARNRDLKAVVTDGATMRSIADIPADERWASAHMFPVLLTVMLLSGSQPGEPLVDLAARTSPTPMLLIAAGSIPQEIRVNEDYAKAAGASAELWALPDVRHTAAVRAEADAYERRVVGHFDRALG